MVAEAGSLFSLLPYSVRLARLVCVLLAELGNGHDLGSIRCSVLVLDFKLKHATGMFHRGCSGTK